MWFSRNFSYLLFNLCIYVFIAVNKRIRTHKRGDNDSKISAGGLDALFRATECLYDFPKFSWRVQIWFPIAHALILSCIENSINFEPIGLTRKSAGLTYQIRLPAEPWK